MASVEGDSERFIVPSWQNEAVRARRKERSRPREGGSKAVRRRPESAPPSEKLFENTDASHKAPTTIQQGSGVRPVAARRKEANVMGVILLVLLVALLLGGLGFAVHALWVIAVIVFAAWLIGFGISRGEAAGGGRRRWYGRW